MLSVHVQQVSRLLALTYVVSSLRENLASLSSSNKMLSGNYWAAYFHQASVGSHHNITLLSANTLKRETQVPCKVKVWYLIVVNIVLVPLFLIGFAIY